MKDPTSGRFGSFGTVEVKDLDEKTLQFILPEPFTPFSITLRSDIARTYSGALSAEKSSTTRSIYSRSAAGHFIRDLTANGKLSITLGFSNYMKIFLKSDFKYY
jgi:hypothetical protein